MLIQGHKGCAVAVFLLIAYTTMMYFNVQVSFTRNELTMVLLTNAAASILIPATVIITIRGCRAEINEIRDNADYCKKQNCYFPISVSLGTLLGWQLPRIIFPNVSMETASVIGAVAIMVLVLLFVETATTCYYKVHLIRKYCPHLK